MQSSLLWNTAPHSNLWYILFIGKSWFDSMLITKFSKKQFIDWSLQRYYSVILYHVDFGGSYTFVITNQWFGNFSDFPITPF